MKYAVKSEKQTKQLFSDERQNSSRGKSLPAVPVFQKVEEEEPLQGKFETAQRIEEEVLLQGKFDAVQRIKEKQPIQCKLETAEKVEDESVLQGKFETVQRIEEEELLQGKFETAQRIEEEELLQGKFETVQRKANNTGLPDQLKSGIENLSGMSMDHVKVHYNSSQPAQLNAHAYAQGSDIHLASGQERHLPHEAWHVVQQAQGRVKPTVQMKGGVPVNDDVSLETEADVMGAKAQSMSTIQYKKTDSESVKQLYANKHVYPEARHHYNDGWGAGVKVQNDDQLKAKVDDSVTGSGTVSLGIWYAPMAEQDINDRKKAKEVTIIYKDGKFQDETAIKHCGPSGKIYWSNWP